MKRSIYQSILLLLLVLLCMTGFLLVKHILQLPFEQTNDALHKTRSAFTLDFLIPSATYIDKKMTTLLLSVFLCRLSFSGHIIL